MSGYIKNGLIFTAGGILGAAVSGILLIRAALKSETLRSALASVLSDKIYSLIFGERIQRPHDSYRYYYDFRKNNSTDGGRL